MFYFFHTCRTEDMGVWGHRTYEEFIITQFLFPIYVIKKCQKLLIWNRLTISTQKKQDFQITGENVHAARRNRRGNIKIHKIFISDTPYTFMPVWYKHGTSYRLLVFVTDVKICTSDMPSVCIQFRIEHLPLPFYKSHWWMFSKQDSALALVPLNNDSPNSTILSLRRIKWF